MKVFVSGIGISAFGELWGISPRKLIKEVCFSALKEAGISKDKIDAIYVSNMLSGILGNQENMGSFVSDTLSIKNIPSFHIEGACASGGLAVHQGVQAIVSGEYEVVLVVGVEKMTDHDLEEVSAALMAAGSEEERHAGLTFPGLYALIAQSYMRTYNITEEEMASVSVKNHFHASLNKKAHFQKKISIEDVLKSPPIAEPLKLLDCSPISDGASCLILSKKPLGGACVAIVASAVSTDSLSLAKRDLFIHLSASIDAGRKAFHQAGVDPVDIEVCEVHDCFSIAEIIALEDLGFYKRGTAGVLLKQGHGRLGNTKGMVINPSGGLKACGHPVGATGVKQVAEIVEQLRKSAGKRQVDHAQIGLTHNVGGSGAISAVHILKRIKK